MDAVNTTDRGQQPAAPGSGAPAHAPTLFDDAASAFTDYRHGQTGRMSDLVRLATPALWALARSTRLSPAQAEDVIQTVWVRLVQNAESILEPQGIFAWLLTTTRREAWRVAGNSTREATVDDRLDQVASAAPGPEAVVTELDASARLWQHVTALSPRCQALLRVIAFVTPPDYASISAALGMPVGSIGPTRGRCLAALRKSLSDDPTWSPA